MRLITASICILVISLWGRLGHADIFVWIDENEVKHITNVKPPPGAVVLMQFDETPVDEAAVHEPSEDQRQLDLRRARAETREQEARLAERRKALQQKLDEAERQLVAAQQRLEELEQSTGYAYDSRRRYSRVNIHYPREYRYQGQRFSQKGSEFHIGTSHHKSRKYHQNHPFGRRHHYHKHTDRHHYRYDAK